MNDIIESIIISEGTCDNDEYTRSGHTLTHTTTILPKINEESRSTSNNTQTTSSDSQPQDYEEDEPDDKQTETVYDSELDESTTFINYTHSYELEDAGTDSSDQSFSHTIEDDDENESQFENRTKTNSELSSNQSN